MKMLARLNFDKFFYFIFRFFHFRVFVLITKFLSIERLEQILQYILKQQNYTTNVFTGLAFEGFYRARVHNKLEGNETEEGFEIFKREYQFKSLPLGRSRIGRCNEEGQSIFYCALDFDTAVREVKPNNNDFITVVSFANKYEPQFKHLIFPIGVGYLMKIPVLKKNFKSMDLSERISFKRLDNFLDYIFHIDSAKYYKYSNAVVRILMTPIVSTNDNRKVDGILYSSIVRNYKSVNIAFRKEFEDLYRINVLQTFKVMKSDNKMFLKLIRVGKFNTQQQIIDWLELSEGNQEVTEIDA